jgi:DNA-directed RNA polymerase specialized sigma24 family protein
MSTQRHRARSCQRCTVSGFDVSDVNVDGRTLALCPQCNKKVTLGDPDFTDLDSEETLPDPELDVDVPVDLLDELTRAQRQDYAAVVLAGVKVVDRANQRGVTEPAVSQNVSNARKNLRSLAMEATAR